MKTVWKSVRRASPCPICSHGDWCGVSADGTLAACRRIEQGCYKSKNDKSCVPVYLHRLNGDDARSRVDPPPNGSTAKRADDETLHRVYDALLGSLVVTQSHRDNLRHRGLSDAEIDRRLYRSLPRQGLAKLARELADRFGAETLLSVPGFIAKDGARGKFITIAGRAGMLIPCRNVDGKIVALKIRRDAEGDGPRYCYLSSSKCGGPGPGSPCHIPLGIGNPAEAVRITEGELKSDIAFALSNVPTISFPGVGSWRGVLPTIQQLRTTTVFISFDADANDKPAVARALADCYQSLIADGFKVCVERWDAAHGKGVDDILASGHKADVLRDDAARAYVAETLATATAGEPIPPPSALNRLAEVLADGVEAFFSDKGLLSALAYLAESDPAEWHCVRAKINGAGIGLRALADALAPLRRKIRADKPPPDSAKEYLDLLNRIVHIRQTKDGPIETPLTNFVARIVSVTVHDDGAERSTRLGIEGTHADGSTLPRVEIPADKFHWLEWIIPAWGTRAIINAGASTKDHVRCAIQKLSKDVAARTVFAHTGWRTINGQSVYLHAAGGIGADGVVEGVETQLPDALTRYVLPSPPNGDELRNAVRESLRLFGLA